MVGRSMCCVGIFWASVASGQLAITEVLSVSKTNATSGFHGAEFWELTNFGTNDMPLNGYGFRDEKPNRPLTREPFRDLVIHGSESIIFFRIEPNDPVVVTPEQFKAWWGISKLPQTIQCRTNTGPGLSAWDGDELWLFDATNNFVDSITFGPTEYGHSFTYNPATGLFDSVSEGGVDGAFMADLTEDVGSPGWTAGPVDVHILQQPPDTAADGGMTVTISALVGGLPRPRYQWYFNQAPIAGADSPSLTLSNLQSPDAGAYFLVATNGLSGATSQVALLTVNTNPTAAAILKPPKDVTVFYGQTAAFSVSARGYPPPAYTWRTNGNYAATGPVLELANIVPGLNATAVSVTASNSSGSATASATLTVTPRPNLRFTEVMAVPANSAANRHFGWVELTNFDTNAINLLGWRFSENYSLVGAVTITNATQLKPGESLVIAERLNRTRFANWWGTNRLPSDFKLYTYSGFGLDDFGGQFLLWNAAARDPYRELVAQVSWAGSIPGISYECEHWCTESGCESMPSNLSVLGERGAFAADAGGDVGSPGLTDSPPLRIISIAREPQGDVTVTCKVAAGKSYGLWRSPALSPPAWTALQTNIATNNLVSFTDSPNGETSFYRVEEVP